MKTLIAALTYWWNRPSRWYEFWMPRSGLPGGMIAGLFFFALILPLTNCAALGLQTADTFNQKLAYSYGQVTAARKGATAVVNASCPTPDKFATPACQAAVADGKHVQAMADQAREGLDLAKGYAAAGNLAQANIQLQLESAALTALSTYLAAKGVQ